MVEILPGEMVSQGLVLILVDSDSHSCHCPGVDSIQESCFHCN